MYIQEEGGTNKEIRCRMMMLIMKIFFPPPFLVQDVQKKVAIQ